MASARAAPTGRPRLPHLCAHCSAFSHFCAQLFGFVLFLVLTTVAICSVQINLINYTSIYAADFDLSQILNTYDKQNCVPLFLLFSSFLYFLLFFFSFVFFSSLSIAFNDFPIDIFPNATDTTFYNAKYPLWVSGRAPGQPFKVQLLVNYVQAVIAYR